jgi:hypothetical protein
MSETLKGFLFLVSGIGLVYGLTWLLAQLGRVIYGF